LQESIQLLTTGPSPDNIDDFFPLFPAIYALTSTPDALKRVTRAVLYDFLDGDHPQCTYLELRTTPRATPSMNHAQYLLAVLDELEKYSPDQAGLIVSLDRRMTAEVMSACVEIAIRLKSERRRVIGVDLCGDPKAGDVSAYKNAFRKAREGGLGVTMHIAEVGSGYCITLAHFIA
jgi:adenosine deaminase